MVACFGEKRTEQFDGICIQNEVMMAKKRTSFFDMQFITSSISTMLVLLLLGMVVFFVLSAKNLSKYVRENISFTVMLSDDMKEPEALTFQKVLNEKPYVKESAYISKELALNQHVLDRQEVVGTAGDRG